MPQPRFVIQSYESRSDQIPLCPRERTPALGGTPSSSHEAPVVGASACLDDPPELTRLGNRSQKCLRQQLVVVGLGAFEQDQVCSTRRLIAHSPEPAAGEDHDEIAVLHLDNEVR
jgi:hypothetical protein